MIKDSNSIYAILWENDFRLMILVLKCLLMLGLEFWFYEILELLHWIERLFCYLWRVFNQHLVKKFVSFMYLKYSSILLEVKHKIQVTLRNQWKFWSCNGILQSYPSSITHGFTHQLDSINQKIKPLTVITALLQ